MRSKTFGEFLEKWDSYSTKHQQAVLKIDPKVEKEILRSSKTFLRRHREFSALEKIHLKGRRISEKRQKLLIKNAIKSERDCKKATRLSIELFKNQKAALESTQQFIIENFEDVCVFSNPIFFANDLRGKLSDIGLSMKEMRFYHYALFNNVSAKAFKRIFQKRSFYSILEQASKDLDRVPFPESLEIMKKKGMITISGCEEAVPYIVGAVTTVVGAALCVASFYVPVLAPIAITVITTGASLIFEEAVQDISGTQDGYWSIAPYNFPIVTFPIHPSDSDQPVYWGPNLPEDYNQIAQVPDELQKRVREDAIWRSGSQGGANIFWVSHYDWPAVDGQPELGVVWAPGTTLPGFTIYVEAAMQLFIYNAIWHHDYRNYYLAWPVLRLVSQPISAATAYSRGYYGNHNRSKMEVHRMHCSWLHLINPSNIRIYGSLDDAHSAGLDNCHYCIGGSKR